MTINNNYFLNITKLTEIYKKKMHKKNSIKNDKNIKSCEKLLKIQK